MTISVVLRVAATALAEGRLAGEAELVSTGERAVVRDAEELVRFLGGSPDAGSCVPPALAAVSEQGGE